MNEEVEELQLQEREVQQQEGEQQEEVEVQQQEMQQAGKQGEEEEMQQQEDRQAEEVQQVEGEQVQQEDLQQQEQQGEEEVEMQQKQDEVQQSEVVEEEEEMQQVEELQQTEEEEEQQQQRQEEEARTEGVSWTVQQQSEEEQEFEKEQQQIEEAQEFVDALEQNHNNQVLIRLRGMQKYKSTSQRLKGVLEQMDRGIVDLQELRRNLELAAAMLDAVYTDETRWDGRKRLLDTEDELSDLQAESVPSEVRDWLACTFSRKMGVAKRRPEEKPRFRSIVHAVQAGIFVERMYRRTSNMAGLTYPPTALTALKEVDQWSFDVFSFHEATGDHALKFLVYDLLTRYDLVNRFRIPVQALVQFVEALENGYSKHRNPYHNLIHAADVTQTAHFLMLHTGLMHWLSELEILAMVFAAAIHDFEHTGTTNNFHIHTRELRSLVIEMVMSTDMSCHFQQIKTMRNALTQTHSIDKVKVLSLMLHAADISHPAKAWPLHYRWTHSLMEEFFRQGDKEVELGLPFSPLCDRKATMIAQSQIGFIDFIVEPTFSVLIDTTEKVIGPLIEEDRKARETGNRRSSLTGSGSVTVESVQRHNSGRHGNSDDGQMDFSLTAIDLPALRLHLSGVIASNKDRWKELSVQELANKEREEQERLESNINSDVQSLPASPNHSVPDGHTSDQSQNSDGSPPDQTQGHKSPDHMPADHLTWNGARLGEEKEEEEEEEEEEDNDEVPENA
ncbi:calcium/calmodulin-dependent 3',5'-cyclic nucleotide phosphodiesterase 1A isoform X3 [Seriola dumerili]|uniref:calcium/calmodulin-dependent 3',5'-cyclic nucleotide phosphodiesterase 1A isoform X3 n=1 Tax=Seriola dumerili TaxID=41447 RepID=UPI000BBEA067|nr:calcium/calmodulin-dependent 3',5'-cyclic nucleotide phosphodiesterase 1A isoform X3 [Seriola dumerili]